MITVAIHCLYFSVYLPNVHLVADVQGIAAVFHSIAWDKATISCKLLLNVSYVDVPSYVNNEGATSFGGPRVTPTDLILMAYPKVRSSLLSFWKTPFNLAGSRKNF